MKKLFLIAVTTLLGSSLLAQPQPAQVKTDFTKNGVTAVEEIKSEKTTYKDRAAWIVSLRTVQPVKPEEVGGKTGVTLVRNWNAVYECKGTTCKITKQVQLGSAFKGMDIPAPDNKALAGFVQKIMWSEPQQLVNTMQYKSSFDSVKAEEPAINWISPKELTYTALIYYTEKQRATERIILEAPLTVTIKRPELASDFSFSNAVHIVERTRELGRQKIDIGSTKDKDDPETDPAPPVAGAWKKGDKVQVQEGGKWYPATVLFAKKDEWFVHYNDYDSSHDEWVAASRIKNK